MDFAYKLLAVEVNRRDLVAHELLLCRLALLKDLHLGVSADNKEDIIVLAGELDALSLEKNHRDDLALLDRQVLYANVRA